MKTLKLVLCVLFVCFISSLNLNAATVTLTPSNSHVCVNKSGTVTFSGNGTTLEEIAIREGLDKVSGHTFKAAVIYDVAFSRDSFRGKIFNCTDNEIKIKCTYYNGSQSLGTFEVYVKPRTFSRFPGSVKNCNKIVCSD